MFACLFVCLLDVENRKKVIFFVFPTAKILFRCFLQALGVVAQKLIVVCCFDLLVCLSVLLAIEGVVRLFVSFVLLFVFGETRAFFFVCLVSSQQQQQISLFLSIIGHDRCCCKPSAIPLVA